ncbi:hypothetical protein BJ944DRAFT_245188 [Cunninghamella echinulata]|nr:hypothetical protein BJ944DRAFT_245188 [Cunninghamella echinulata]
MQYNNNNQYYPLENQVTEQFYAGEQPTALPQMYSDDQLTTTTTTTKKQRTTNDKNKKTKRKQVKNACINCQKACKKCDEGRACQRCIKLGIADTCVDSPRKERLKGVKRGPYKKRQKQNVPTLNRGYDMNESPFKYEQQQQQQPIMWNNDHKVLTPIQTTTTIMSSPSSTFQQQSPLSTTHLMDNTNMMYSQDSSSFMTNESLLSSPIHSLNDAYYSSSSSSTSSSTSPESTTMILPQDTLHMFSLDDMNYPMNPSTMSHENHDLMMMMPLQQQQDNWSNLSSPIDNNNTQFIPQLSQPIYQQQQQQFYYQQPQPQPKLQQQMMYFDASSIDWLNPSLLPSQPYM